MRDVRKLFENIDKEIKRQSSTATLPQIKTFTEKDTCTKCGKEEGYEKVTICK